MESSSPHLERAKSYKGEAFPPPFIPVIGLVLSTGIPGVIIQFLPMEWTSIAAVDSVLLLLQTLSICSLLFFAEFDLGAAARSKSSQASFSPAAAQAFNVDPFAVVEANRIQQNQIASLCMYIPAVMGAAAAGSNPRYLVASVLTCYLSRVLYRVGYQYAKNPFWRITGVTMTVTQTMLCWALIIAANYS
jgi:uncharacterized MAPEG superfamily protein